MKGPEVSSWLRQAQRSAGDPGWSLRLILIFFATTWYWVHPSHPDTVSSRHSHSVMGVNAAAARLQPGSASRPYLGTDAHNTMFRR